MKRIVKFCWPAAVGAALAGGGAGIYYESWQVAAWATAGTVGVIVVVFMLFIKLFMRM